MFRTEPSHILLAGALVVGMLSEAPISSRICCDAPAVSQSPVSKGGFLLGRVIDAQTRAPIAGAIIEAQGRASLPSVLADEAGWFLIHDMPEGVYRILGSARGYLDGGFGQDVLGAEVARVEISAERAAHQVEIELWRSATIRGRVADEAGVPITGVAVVALRLRQVLAGRTTRPDPAITDDRGEYSLTGLAPGAYVVGIPFGTRSVIETERGQDSGSAAGRGFSPIGIRVGRTMVSVSRSPETGSPALVSLSGSQVLVRLTTWFQQATDHANATPVRVQAGEIRSGVDIVPPTDQGVSVSGRVSGVSPGGVVLVRLERRWGNDPLVQISREVARSESLPTGEFVLAGVPPGDYMLAVDQRPETVTGRGFAAVRTSIPMMWARVPLSVGPETLSGVAVTLRPGLVLRGRIITDEPETRGSALASVSGLTLNSPGRSTVAPARAPDGTFTAESLLPGPYSFRVNAPAGWVLGWIRIEGRTFTARSIDVQDDLDDVTLVLTRRFGRIEGSLAAGLAPVPAGSVAVMFPTDRSRWRDASGSELETREVPVRMDGRFTIESVPPGEYFVAVVGSDALDPRWRRETMLTEFTRSAGRVVLGGAETRTVEILRLWAR